MITIITPSYNRAELITQAITSVLAQDFPDFEHIIVDGGSTDGTLDILKKYPHLKVIHGLDKGMYDALNKGLEIANGQIVGFLNTDDLYGEDIFTAIATKFDDPDVMAVAGRALVFAELPDGEARVVNQYSPEERSLIECSTIGSNFFNAWFFRRSIFDRIGKFNSDYKIVGDRDFMLRFALKNLKYITINNLVYKYRMHPDSLTFDKTDEKRTLSANEDLALIDTFLADQDLPRLARKLLIRVRTSETTDMAARSMWMWNYKKFFYYVFEGFKYDFLWPLKFVQYILRRGTALLLARRFAASLC